ncbi:archaetidylserine decarboxylase [Legionella dresdenensis]|uniref:Phosphatidylserine decarboxylase proenzyme n=1 Tax=Legionella dresdenensis TaxID=450200 RepID=A0ABV8CDL1_9GAMM
MFTDYLKTLPQYCIPKQTLTTFAGLLANVTSPAIKNNLIQRFIGQYGVNMNEALIEDPTAYACFNDFFIRQLKPDARILADADIVSPVDGVVSELGQIREGQILQAKGRYYSVDDFLACDKAVSQTFTNGHFATLYLSPKDYHRIHMPLDATLHSMIYVPGRLFSVQPTTARVVPHLFARNERLVVFFNTRVGLMAMVLVGATIVGAINVSWHGDLARSRTASRFDYSEQALTLRKGEEMGYFKLGSTVVLMFADNSRIDWLADIQAGCPIQFGQALAKIN